ncbi:MAG: hypothetical protein VX278_03290 [Myxococcota bacterium]|nr:hypothetical protein [Myxococcota bacterium]
MGSIDQSVKNPPRFRRWHSFFLSLVIAIAITSAYGLCTQDDAFISFRYAENVWLGHGLVFNAGERVEGISNPLWTLLCVFPFALGLDPAFFSVLMGLASLVLLMWGTMRLAEHFSIAGWMAVWIVALDPSLLLESMEGLETTFYAALICWSIVWGVREAKDDRPFVRSTFLFALASITRPDAPYLFALFHLGQIVFRKQWKRSFWAGVGLGAFLAVITALRLGYYGEYLPNTFYAKVGGLAWERGLLYLQRYFQYHLLILVGILFAWKGRSLRPLLLVYIGYVLYVCSIGGDFKPTSRFLLPLTSIGAVFAVGFIQRWSRPVQLLALILLFVAPRYLLFRKSQGWAQTRRSNLIARRVAGEWIRSHTSPNVVLAMHSVGVIPFYAKRKTIDMWGLNDKVIARTPVENFGSGMAGHERSNPSYVFAQKPDLYLPEDDLFLPKKVEHSAPKDYPASFANDYRSISIQIEASWLNIWVRKDLIQDKTNSKPSQEALP